MDEDVDILSLDREIKKKYEEDDKNITIYEKRKTMLNKILDNDKLSSCIITKINNDILKLDTLIDEIKSKHTYNFYVMETTHLIDSYKKIIQEPIIIDFLTNKVQTKDDKKIIVKNYLKIYNKYNNKNKIISKEKINKQCNICNHSSLFAKYNEIICENCGNSYVILLQNSSYKDSERINIIPKYTYDRKSHFRDCINQFQGKQVVNIPQVVYDDLIYQFNLNHLLIGDDTTPKEQRFKNITKKHIQMFLKETNHSKHYEDITYIYHHLTGKEVNDISHIERYILEDFDILTEAYDKMYKKDDTHNRKSFINSQYVLYQLLRKYNYGCDKEDFNILKTSDRQNFHDDVCKELFKGLGWNFKCIF